MFQWREASLTWIELGLMLVVPIRLVPGASKGVAELKSFSNTSGLWAIRPRFDQRNVRKLQCDTSGTKDLRGKK
jgi:hypothetical protein